MKLISSCLRLCTRPIVASLHRDMVCGELYGRIYPYLPKRRDVASHAVVQVHGLDDWWPPMSKLLTSNTTRSLVCC